MDAEAQGKLIVVALIAVALAYWAWTRRRDRRHRSRFDALAAAFDASVTAPREYEWVFPATAAGRPFRVESSWRGGGQYAGPGGLLVTSTPLAGVRDVHSVEVRPRWLRALPTDARDADFADHFVVHDLGYPLREGWLTERVRTALLHFYQQEPRLGGLHVERGELAHLWPVDLADVDAANLRELLARQAALAEALERAL